MSVVQTHGYYDMTHADVELALPEGFLQPELLQLNFTTFLYFAFPFAAFLVFALIGRAGTAVFEFNLRTHRPTLAEVITEIDHHVRKRELAMAWIVLIFSGIHVAVYIITIEHAAQGHLAIAAHAETLAAGMTHHGISRIHLGFSRKAAA